MPKVPRISGSDAVRAFSRAGFALKRIRGSHHILVRFRDGRQVTLAIPLHAGKTVAIGLLKSTIEAAGLTIEQFIELL